MLKYTNKNRETGSLVDAVKGKDVFIGVSRPKMLTSEMIKTMAIDPIVFAMANPIPEIMPDEAKESGVFVLGTGRSDFPNQVNNVLAFPGVFKGALECRASEINEAMKVAAAKAIADFIPAEKLSREYILPNAFETGVADAVAEAVKRAAIDTKVNKIEV